MGKLLNFATSTQTPRWAIIAGFIISLAASTCIEFIRDGIKSRGEGTTQQVQSMLDSMVQFQVYASALASEMFEKKSISYESKSNVIRNLNEQWAKLALFESRLPISDKNEINNYRTSITMMLDATQRLSDITQMGDFWTAASKLTVARNRLSVKLKALT